MLPDRVSNPGPLTYESGALPIVLRGPASTRVEPVLVRTPHSIVQYKVASELTFTLFLKNTVFTFFVDEKKKIKKNFVFRFSQVVRGGHYGSQPQL